MCGKQLGILAVELEVLVVADVQLREVILVEVAILENVAFRQYLLLLQLALGAENEPGGVQFLVLLLHLVLVGAILFCQRSHVVAESGDGIALHFDEGILLCQACLQFLNASCLDINLGLQVLDGLLHLCALDAAVLKFLLQLSNHFAILLHGLLDKLHVFVNHLAAAGTLGIAVGNRYSAFCLVDTADAFLHFVEGAQNVIQFHIFFVDDTLQGVTFLLSSFLLSASHVACTQSEGTSYHKKNLFHLRFDYLRFTNYLQFDDLQ